MGIQSNYAADTAAAIPGWFPVEMHGIMSGHNTNMAEHPDTETMRLVLLEILSTEILESVGGLDATTDLFEAGMDSLGTMQLLVRIEQRFGVQLPASGLTRENSSTVGALVGLIESQQCGRARQSR